MTTLPAVSLLAMPGKRVRALELAREVEDRGFEGIYCPSGAGDQLPFLTSLLHVTSRVHLGTAIEPIYARSPEDLAQTAAYLHEVSGECFRLGLGVSHEPMNRRRGVEPGPPLSDMREYVKGLHAASDTVGPLPPIILATLRDKMLQLATEIGDGAMWANGARSYFPKQLQRIPADVVHRGFVVANMIPTVVDEDRTAARAVHRRTLQGKVVLPNYRNYWKAAGYIEEMEAIEAALAAGAPDRVPELMSDRWLDDVTLSGSPADIRDGVEAWREAGVTTPILVPSSTSGGQFRALAELFAVYAR